MQMKNIMNQIKIVKQQIQSFTKSFLKRYILKSQYQETIIKLLAKMEINSNNYSKTKQIVLQYRKQYTKNAQSDNIRRIGLSYLKLLAEKCILIDMNKNKQMNQRLQKNNFVTQLIQSNLQLIYSKQEILFGFGNHFCKYAPFQKQLQQELIKMIIKLDGKTQQNTILDISSLSLRSKIAEKKLLQNDLSSFVNQSKTNSSNFISSQQFSKLNSTKSQSQDFSRHKNQNKLFQDNIEDFNQFKQLYGKEEKEVQQYLQKLKNLKVSVNTQLNQFKNQMKKFIIQKQKVIPKDKDNQFLIVYSYKYKNLQPKEKQYLYKTSKKAAIQLATRQFLKYLYTRYHQQFKEFQEIKQRKGIL